MMFVLLAVEKAAVLPQGTLWQVYFAFEGVSFKCGEGNAKYIEYEFC